MQNTPHQRPRVLVIDNEVKVLQEVENVLHGAGFACCCCRTATEALAAIEIAPAELIVCDLHLQGESGMETCQAIQQRSGMENVPVMFLSGAQLPDIIRRSHAAGNAVYCLRKPFSPDVLVELIDQALAVPQA